jgi:hypothetical protein
MDAVSICAQVEMSVGLVMVRVKDKAGWRQWAMSPMGNEGKREVGRESADGGCSFLGATRNINTPLLTAGPAKPNTSNTAMPPVSPNQFV